LTWGYHSLRIPEIGHQLKSTARIIAYTAARTRREDALQLFDGYIQKGSWPEEMAAELDRALREEPRRLPDQTAIDNALSVILRTAGCYGEGISLRHGSESDLASYRKEIKILYESFN